MVLALCAGSRCSQPRPPALTKPLEPDRQRRSASVFVMYGQAGSRAVGVALPGGDPMPHHTSDTRITGYEPLLAPAALLDELPLGASRATTVEQGRTEIRNVLDMDDDRLLVVVGPCSVHDPKAALDYARQLAEVRRSLSDDLLIVMRVYFEKPRTVTGWKGLINDPRLNGSYDVHTGLRAARRLLLDVVELGLPVACEGLGARTTESQIHRQLASGLSMPMGFKNGTDGDAQVAIDACRAAAAQHTFFGVTPAGAAAVVTTAGNADCHIILRGGRSGPNYHASDVTAALDAVATAKLPRRNRVGASHGNSERDCRRQSIVAETLGEQIAAGEPGLVGIMLESFLQAGRQEPGPLEGLVYGQSVTDGCMDIDTTVGVLNGLAAAVRKRRSVTPEGARDESMGRPRA